MEVHGKKVKIFNKNIWTVLEVVKQYAIRLLDNRFNFHIQMGSETSDAIGGHKSLQHPKETILVWLHSLNFV